MAGSGAVRRAAQRINRSQEQAGPSDKSRLHRFTRLHAGPFDSKGPNHGGHVARHHGAKRTSQPTRPGRVTRKHPNKMCGGGGSRCRGRLEHPVAGSFKGRCRATGATGAGRLQRPEASLVMKHEPGSACKRAVPTKRRTAREAEGQRPDPATGCSSRPRSTEPINRTGQQNRSTEPTNKTVHPTPSNRTTHPVQQSRHPQPRPRHRSSNGVV